MLKQTRDMIACESSRLAASVLFLTILHAGPAAALDDAYCNGYGATAVAQTNEYNSRRCPNPGNSQWWSTDPKYHINWCKTLRTPDLAELGKADRAKILAGCGPAGRLTTNCRQLMNERPWPQVCDIDQNKTLAEVCREARRRDAGDRIGQLAAASTREVLHGLRADLENYLIRKDAEYDWKIGVSMVFFVSGAWVGAAMEATGYGFLSQLATGAALSTLETQIDKLEFQAVKEAFVLNWADGVISDGAVDVAKEIVKKRLVTRFAQTQAKSAAEKLADEYMKNTGPLFIGLDFIRRVGAFMQSQSNSISYEQGLGVLQQVDLEIAKMDGYFSGYGKNRANLAAMLKQSACP